MSSRAKQLLALVIAPDEDTAACAQSDLFREFGVPFTSTT
jgi:hypothetical protein